MDNALAIHRLQFAFTVTFHYIFPQLTMGLALLLLVLKTMALKTGNEHYNQAARFWVKIFTRGEVCVELVAARGYSPKCFSKYWRSRGYSRLFRPGALIAGALGGSFSRP